MSTYRFHPRTPRVSWVRLSLLAGVCLTVVWTAWDSSGLDARLVRDGVTFLVIPSALALAYGRDLGWRVDRRAVRNTLLLAGFVLPPIREFYPMWGLETAAAGAFLPHAAKQFAVVIAAETYYRGLLCVGVREIGFKSVFISPVAYAVAHLSKPPIELVLSGPTDVLFGAVDYRSRSILPSIVAHGVGLALLDWLVLQPPVPV